MARQDIRAAIWDRGVRSMVRSFAVRLYDWEIFATGLLVLLIP